MLSLIVIITCLSQAFSSQTNGLACPEGWERLDSKCYLIVTGKPTTWNLARQDCHENGGKLALPMDKAENDGIYDLYEKRAKIIKRFWIDAIALDENFPLVYTTREGQELNFTQWKNGQPNDKNGCGFMGTDLGSVSVWVDIPCNWKYDYICETKLQENKKGTCSFEDNVLFVETSIQKVTIEDCQEFCQTIVNCEVSTYDFILLSYYNRNKSHSQFVFHMESRISRMRNTDFHSIQLHQSYWSNFRY